MRSRLLLRLDGMAGDGWWNRIGLEVSGGGGRSLGDFSRQMIHLLPGFFGECVQRLKLDNQFIDCAVLRGWRGGCHTSYYDVMSRNCQGKLLVLAFHRRDGGESGQESRRPSRFQVVSGSQQIEPGNAVVNRRAKDCQHNGFARTALASQASVDYTIGMAKSARPKAGLERSLPVS